MTVAPPEALERNQELGLTAQQMAQAAVCRVPALPPPSSPALPGAPAPEVPTADSALWPQDAECSAPLSQSTSCWWWHWELLEIDPSSQIQKRQTTETEPLEYGLT